MGRITENIFKTIIPSHCKESFLPLESPNLQLLREMDVQMAGVSQVVDGYQIVRQRSKVHLFLYTGGGKGCLTSDGGESCLGPGSLLIAPAHTTHTYRAAGPEWEIAWFHLSDTPRWRRLRGQHPEIRKRPALEVLPHLMRALVREDRHSRGERMAMARATSQLVRLHVERELLGQAPPADIHLDLHLLLDRVESSLGRSWNVKALAREIGYSEPHVYNLFRDHFQASPMQLIADLRMRRARELLRHTTYPVKQISRMVGYQSPYSFSAVFKKHVGQSPTGCRSRAG